MTREPADRLTGQPTDDPGLPPSRFGRSVRRFVLVLCLAPLAYIGLSANLILAYRWLDPPVTTVQVQRQLEALWADGSYRLVYRFRPASAISSHLTGAVVAAEDNRFYDHRGFDLGAIETAVREGGRRGASTISQQVAKNLFLTTHRSYLRKAFEVPLTIVLELFLPKERILELYVNVAEWGDGVFGAEAAAQHYFGISADQLSRQQAAALAACLPDPRRRQPRLDGRYTRIILNRMNQLGY